VNTLQEALIIRNETTITRTRTEELTIESISLSRQMEDIEERLRRLEEQAERDAELAREVELK